MRASFGLEDDHGRPDPKESGDTKSPVVLFELANKLVAAGDVEGAIKHLNTSLDILPEYTKAMGLLASQYRRARDPDKSIIFCLKAIRSPMSFGRINEQLPIWFSRQREAPEAVRNDPLWKRRTDLTWKFGGAKENDNYRVLQEIIEEYAEMKQWKNWFNLSQVYSELMCGETGAFQERYDFNPKEWRINQVDTYREKTGVDRNVLRQYKVG
jgi:tetratricopeptide (TPR) repeat protein